MEIGEFRKQFMEQLRFDAEHEGSAPEAQFISRALAVSYTHLTLPTITE